MKNYNPFLMLGSWIGVGLSLLYFLIATKMQWFDARDIILRIGFSLDTQTNGFIFGTILTIILGFILGWGIQSLYRKIQKKRVFWIGLIIVILLMIFGAQFLTVIPEDATAYRTLTFTPTTLTLSGVIAPDHNSIMTNHLFAQWVGGNANYFELFYKNIGFLPFYIQQGLSINVNDFNILAGDGDKVMYGTHLKPNYCRPAPAYSTFNYLDSDGCPRYISRALVTPCCCYSGDRVCNYPSIYPPSCLPAGAWSSSWSDCSVYSTLDENYGGSTSGTKNYKTILEADGWTWDGSAGAWNKGSPTGSVAESIASKLTCIISGTSDKGVYSFSGKVKWMNVNGFSCQVDPQDFRGAKISDGKVEFSVAQVSTYYRLENNQCSTISMLENQKTSNDYSSLSDCNSKIIVPQTPCPSGYTGVQPNCQKIESCESTNICSGTGTGTGTEPVVKSNWKIFAIVFSIIIVVIISLVVFLLRR